jgi:CubicO group peptidase (beta-lactamase class C family)
MSKQETVSRRSAIRTALGAGAGLVLPSGFGARRASATHNPWMVTTGSTWPTATPESVGLDTAKLLEAQAYATRFAGGAGCVIRNGKLVHSWGVFTQRYPINSATKSWGSVVLGFAVDDAKLAVTGKVQPLLPNLGYKPTSNAGTGWLDDITFAQLATHTAGFAEPSGYSALQAQPGTRFIYSNCGTNWLATP